MAPEIGECGNTVVSSTLKTSLNRAPKRAVCEDGLDRKERWRWVDLNAIIGDFCATIAAAGPKLALRKEVQSASVTVRGSPRAVKRNRLASREAAHDQRVDDKWAWSKNYLSQGY